MKTLNNNWIELTLLELEAASLIKEPLIRLRILADEYSIKELKRIIENYKEVMK